MTVCRCTVRSRGNQHFASKSSLRQISFAAVYRVWEIGGSFASKPLLGGLGKAFMFGLHQNRECVGWRG